MKKYLFKKNIVTALLVTYIYALNIVETVSLVSKIFAVISVFAVVMYVLNNMDKISFDKIKERRKSKVNADA